MSPLQQKLFDILCDQSVDKNTAVSEVRSLLFGLIMSTNDPIGYLEAVIKDYQEELYEISSLPH